MFLTRLRCPRGRDPLTFTKKRIFIRRCVLITSPPLPSHDHARDNRKRKRSRESVSPPPRPAATAAAAGDRYDGDGGDGFTSETPVGVDSDGEDGADIVDSDDGSDAAVTSPEARGSAGSKRRKNEEAEEEGDEEGEEEEEEEVAAPPAPRNPFARGGKTFTSPPRKKRKVCARLICVFVCLCTSWVLPGLFSTWRFRASREMGHLGEIQCRRVRKHGKKRFFTATSHIFILRSKLADARAALCCFVLLPTVPLPYTPT